MLSSAPPLQPPPPAKGGDFTPARTASDGGSRRAGGSSGPLLPAAEIFISPRVIDATAFDDLAGQLRTLIKDAATQVGGLTAASVAAHQAQERSTQLARDLQTRCEAAVKLAAVLEERVAKATNIATTIGKDLVARLSELREFASTDTAALGAKMKATAQSSIDEVALASLCVFTQRVQSLHSQHMESVEMATNQARSQCLQLAQTTIDAATAAKAAASQAGGDFAKVALEVFSSLEADVTALEARARSGIDEGNSTCERSVAATQVLQSLAAEVDVGGLRHAVADANDALAAGTQTALILRELAATGGRDAEMIAEMRSLVERSEKLLPNLSTLITRGDTVGSGLCKLIERAETKL